MQTRGVRSPGAGVKKSFKPSDMVLGTELRSLEEQFELLTADLFYFHFMCMSGCLHVCVYVSGKAIRRCWSPWKWNNNNRWL